MKELFGSIGFGLLAAVLLASPARAQDGAPDARQEVRKAAAMKKLKAEKEISLLYVRGMT